MKIIKKYPWVEKLKFWCTLKQENIRYGSTLGFTIQ